MLQLINLLLAIVGIIATGTGLARMHDHTGAWAILVAGLLVIAIAARSDALRARRVAKRKKEATEKRVEAVKAHPIMPGATLRIPGSRWWLPATIMLIALSAAALYLDLHGTGHDWRLIASGAFLCAFGLLLLARIAPGIGHPALELTTSGIATPLYGEIDWRAITGLCLSVTTDRFDRKHFVIRFRVKDLSRSAKYIPWTDRLFATLRIGSLIHSVVSVPLPSSHEAPPEAVYAAARQQWRLATGNDYDWNPAMSDQFNEALKRAGAITERLNHPRDNEPSLRDLARLEVEMQQASRDAALMGSELKRRRRTFNLVTGALLALMLLAAAVQVTLALMHV